MGDRAKYVRGARLSKRVLITGASSGIGNATALELAAKGYSLVLAARREDLLMQTVAECLKRGAAAVVPVPCDVTRDDGRIRAALALGELPSDLEPCLINNAGIGEFGPFAEMPAEVIESQIQTNLIGAMLLTQTVLPLFAKGGRIINVLSVVAEVPLPQSAAYAASKAGLRMFGLVLQQELRYQGVLITNLMPGATSTDIWSENAPHQDMMPPEAVAETIEWLLSSPPNRVVDEMMLMPPKGIL